MLFRSPAPPRLLSPEASFRMALNDFNMVMGDYAKLINSTPSGTVDYRESRFWQWVESQWRRVTKMRSVLERA